MVFTKQELREKPTAVTAELTLSEEDLLEGMRVTSRNKIEFPIAKVECLDTNFESGEFEITTHSIYSFEGLRNIKIYLDTVHRLRLSEENRKKYIKGEVTSDFKYYGKKILEIDQNSLKAHTTQQKYLLDNNYKQVTVSHSDCGYEFRGGNEELEYRDMIADYVCDGTNDTEILQQAINSNEGENIEIMLFEDEYKVKPTSGSGTAEDPYICLRIDRDNVILRSCDRKTNITVDRNIVKEGDVCYIIAVSGRNVDISNIHFGLDELDIHYVEYKYPEPTKKMLEVKAMVEATDPIEKTYTKAEILRKIKEQKE